ncbi:hypothetical protein F441_07547 [Phytophthora nicotianae CJ01A1]|uniref:CCHC-type domain-containing protein n=3 Tax=Phytophthora nicotianae TaxID=4792 RepID=W2H185_PHYNI|nr:hypothetical protein L915_07394 [Phytophthora nicotianae]ETL41740.1 hypothetical protein L916_07337 [Phytophthora nicotianae]ETO77181.1 hypothetical protein F444_07583 [Phytophthora nicotianae P1976]ETP18193.1 hypothetical protein F441_07547 [Phytophthora nicotianae CJ01A1]
MSNSGAGSVVPTCFKCSIKGHKSSNCPGTDTGVPKPRTLGGLEPHRE